MIYRAVAAETPELIDTAYRLRHRAYCQNAGFERQDLAEMEIDGYDRRAVHIIAFYRDWPLAAARLILPPDIPMRALCPDVDIPASAAEVSRFSIPMPASRQVFDVVAVIRQLAHGIIAAAERHDTDDLYLLMKPALKGLIRRAGFNCEVVGKPVDLNGRRWPTKLKRTDQ